MCRDRFAAKGKPTVHVLDLLFGDDFDARAGRRGPVLTQRAGQRAALKQRLLADVWAEAPPAPDWRDALLLSPELEDLLEHRYIRPEEVLQVVARSEETGRRFVEPSTGRRLASLALGAVTYWAEYEPEDGRFRVHTAYSHRMEFKPPPWPPADSTEHEDGREWRCALGDHPLEPRSVTLVLPGRRLPGEAPRPAWNTAWCSSRRTSPTAGCSRPSWRWRTSEEGAGATRRADARGAQRARGEGRRPHSGHRARLHRRRDSATAASGSRTRGATTTRAARTCKGWDDAEGAPAIRTAGPPAGWERSWSGASAWRRRTR